MQRWVLRRLGVQNLWGLVVKRMPQSLRYWVLVDQGSKHIAGNEVVPDVPFMVILERSSKVGAGAR